MDFGRGQLRAQNPAFAHVDVPLAPTFILPAKQGKEAHVKPVVEGDGYRFTSSNGKGLLRRRGAARRPSAGVRTFAASYQMHPLSAAYINAEAKAGRMGQRLMAIVAEGERGRIYLSPTSQDGSGAQRARLSLSGSRCRMLPAARLVFASATMA